MKDKSAPTLAGLSKPEELGLVSILMPAYNHASFVEKAIRSVWEQDYRPLELIIVDDGSSDATPDIIDSLLAYSPISMELIRLSNRGICGALNIALSHARGEYITILASDDYFRHDKITKQVDALNCNPEASVVHCEYDCIDAAGNLLEFDSSNDLPPAEGDALTALLLLQADVRSVTLMAPRRSFETMGGYDEKFPHEDWQSIIKFATYGPVAHIPDKLVFRRTHSSNVSTTSSRQSKFDMREAGVGHLETVIPPHLNSDQICALHCANSIRVAISNGGWEKAQDGIIQCWSHYPSQRRLLAKYIAAGFTSWLWKNAAVPILPKGAIRRIRKLKRARVRFWDSHY